ncbi:MAG: ParA family protein [Planctomycetota bacterium]
MTAKKIAFINQKGGVGKTTLTANCGAYWGHAGRRVLILDLDPQAHLTLHLGGAAAGEERNLYRVLRGDYSLQDAIIELPDEKVDVIASHIDLSAAEWEFGQEVGREVILREGLKTLLESRPYDLVLMDCPPSLGFLSLNALAAVEEVVIPVQAEFFALQGMSQLLRVLSMVRSRLHPDLQWRAIVPTLVDARTNLGREVIADLERHFPEEVTKHWISKRVKVAEAPGFEQSIFAYAPDSPAAKEFQQLCQELERILEIAPLDNSAAPAADPNAAAAAEAEAPTIVPSANTDAPVPVEEETH